MTRQSVYVVCAQGEEDLAEKLAEPLRDTGYEVTHDGTVLVGESRIGNAMKAMAAGVPIVLCATARSVGSAWAHKIVNAGYAGANRVFVVQMDEQAYVEQLAVKTKVARYDADPATGIRELVDALTAQFPPVPTPAAPRSKGNGLQYLDEPTAVTMVDADALTSFRAQMRTEVSGRYPEGLTSSQFLEQIEVWADGGLTRTGVLLFGRSPTLACPAAMVKCVRYYGLDRSERRDGETYEGPVTDQIVNAREFVAKHVRKGERPSENHAQAVPVYTYPMIAIREIIANALVHRDYAQGSSCVHVRVFDDRVEISSPGDWLGHDIPIGEPHELTEFDGQSKKRNYRLAHVLSWVRLVEGEGSGIPSALRDCRTTGSPIPTVLREQDFITVTVWPCPDEGARSVKPRTLPRGVKTFVGRQAELGWLENSADAGVCLITGAPGTGKTTLAVNFAHQAADRYPDGQLYVDLRGFSPSGRPVQPAEALLVFLEALGVSRQAMPVELEVRVALYRSILAGRRMLVLLDNARSTEQVLPLLPGSAQSRVLVTSRAGLADLVATNDAVQVVLNVFDRGAGLTLLARCLGDSRVAAEPEAAAQLVEYCGGLPLALRIVAARAAAHPEFPLQVLASELNDANSRLAALAGDDSASIRAAFSWTYQALSPESARVFRLLGLHPGPDIGLAAVAAITDMTESQAQQVLREACVAHLIHHYTPGRYRFHDLLRLYAHEQAIANDRDWERDDAIRRVLDHYIEHSRHGDRHWFANERLVLLAAIDLAAQQGLEERAWRLTSAITPFLDQQGLWHDLATVQQTALGAADQAGDRRAQAEIHRNLGGVHGQFGRIAEAVKHYELSLRLCRELRDEVGEAHSELALSKVYGRRNQTDEAVFHARVALDLFRRNADRLGEAEALVTSADCAVQIGALQQALDEYKAARSWYRDLDHRSGESLALEGLGQVHHLLGQFSDAVERYEAALRLSREAGNRYGEAVTLSRLGDTYQALGDRGRARSVWQQAVELLNEFGDPDADTMLAKLDRQGTGNLQQPAIVVVDVERAPSDSLEDGPIRVLRSAFRRTDIDWDACRFEDRGDGVMVMVPATVAKAVFVEALPRALVAAVVEQGQQFKLRVALHSGEVSVDDLGPVGASVNFAFRLVDAIPLRRALEESGSRVAFIVSATFYDNVIRPHPNADLSAYRQVSVAIKETDATAWIHVP
ncbi:tetratricopeptide repeat protein [Kibdelosporangium philippinense]|uniref:Tetratricopeptide repeat protein n=1 Tax=Kibdelosporangium philippinense TaxID=211113 RepID=A0ABS8Z7V9_9PSEU|nr:tetratricopeptide repeat protein [Kibdelosporangium philippinense]MCE7003959.1 tetratricopeptide repeat protein [Kibdelosporangium philippinense]